MALVSSCKQLEKLFLSAQRQLSDRDINAVRENLFATLSKLNIMGTRNISTSSVISLAREATNLKLLDIGYCEQLEDGQFLAQLKALVPDCHIVSSFYFE